MWIRKENYNFLKERADRNIDYQHQIITLKNAVDGASEKYMNSVNELYEIKKDLKYYLDTNEENGVVYIPKFIIEKIILGK